MFLLFSVSSKKRHGFQALQGMTLVEVTLALGLVTFGLMSILATLPTGLAALRDARETMVFSNILRHVEVEYSSRQFSDIAASTLYFDHEGQVLDGNTSASFYRVEVTIENVNYPGKPSGIDTRLKCLKVEMLRRIGNEDKLVGSSTLKIADSGI